MSKGAVGFSDLEDKVPLREDCLFDLASVSKQFTAAAVMLLRRRGLLSLEDEITKFFPEIPYKGVTVRHLLNHTGGLPDYMDWVDKIAKEEKTIPNNAVIVRFLVSRLRKHDDEGKEGMLRWRRITSSSVIPCSWLICIRCSLQS